MYSSFIFFSQFFIFISAEMLCDTYYYTESVSSRLSYIYTIAGYNLPRSPRALLYEKNVPCPRDYNGLLCPRKCCLPGDSFSHDKKCAKSIFSTEGMISRIRREMKISPMPPTDSLTDPCAIYGSFCPTVILPIDPSSLPSEKDYCIDYFRDTGDYEVAQCVTSLHNVNGVSPLYTICLGLSILFLLLTFVIYFTFQSLRNLPGKILLAYVASLLITDSFYVMLQITLINEGTLCKCSAYIIQFSFLASFYWLNVMCFDLWRTFRYRGFNGLYKEADRKKFFMYSLYAWGCPAFIATITFIADSTNIVPYSIKPKLATEQTCWFGDNVALFLYFYSCVSVLLSLNFIMFLHTTIIIIKHNKNQDKLMNGNSSKRHFLDAEKKRFYVYLKLFSIMGINWLMEILSYFYQNDSIFWDVMDACNMLQGIFIFIIFVCKRRVILLLNKKIYPKKIFLGETVKSISVYYSNNGVNSSISGALHKENSKSSLIRTEMSTVLSPEPKHGDNFVVLQLIK